MTSLSYSCITTLAGRQLQPNLCGNDSLTTSARRTRLSTIYKPTSSLRLPRAPQAYVRQMRIDHPEIDPPSLAADAVLAVRQFHRTPKRSFRLTRTLASWTSWTDLPLS